MSRPRSRSLGVDWYLPNAKANARRIATSTQASSDLISMLRDGGHTVESAIDAILFDDEAKAVLQIYSDKGYGSWTLVDLIKVSTLG